MPSLPLIQVDVFTDRPYAGNPLAVVLGGEGLPTGEMQAIAREMNLSETAFILPPSGSEAAFDLRIFTPEVELPFAGHPVLGSTWVAARTGRLSAAPGPRILTACRTGSGIVPLELEGEGGHVRRVTMRQHPPQFGAQLGGHAAALAEALGLPAGTVGIPADIGGLPALVPQVVSTGLGHLMVPVTAADLIARISPDLRRLAGVLGQMHVGGGAYVFAADDESPGVDVRARFFGPGIAVPEDAATGSAAGPLGAYLHRYGRLADGATLVIQQGVEMHRPSRLEVTVGPGHPPAVRVSGGVALVFEGTLYV